MKGYVRRSTYDYVKRELEACRAEAIRPPLVTFRTIAVCFADRTITIDGRTPIRVTSDCVTFPILSGDAVFMPRGVERVA